MKKAFPASPATRKRINTLLYIGAVVSFAAPIVFLAIRWIARGDAADVSGYRTPADYALMITQCVLGLLAIHLPMVLGNRFRFEVPQLLYVLFVLFLYCAIFLGEVRSFYYRVPHWDVVLHSFSSMMAGFFGTMVIAIFNRDEHAATKLAPRFVGAFSFCFGFSLGALWEIYEYILDGLFGYNMQKFALPDGTILMGHAALGDTMKDLMVDALGALIAAIVGVVTIRKGKRWLMPCLTEKSTKAPSSAAEPSDPEAVSALSAAVAEEEAAPEPEPSAFAESGSRH